MPEQDASKPDPHAGEPGEHRDRHHSSSLVTSLVSPPRSVARRVGKLLRRRWAVHLALMVNSLLLVVLSVLVLGGLSNRPEAPVVIEQQPKVAPSDDGKDSFAIDARSVPAPPESSAASWQRAERALAGKRFVEALKDFRVLSVLARSDPKGSLLADFFDLRGGECLRMMAMISPKIFGKFVAYEAARTLPQGPAYRAYRTAQVPRGRGSFRKIP